MALILDTLLLFTSNTLLSPWSRLLSSAPEPDWIPWVSEGWSGGNTLTANSTLWQDAGYQETTEERNRHA